MCDSAVINQCACVIIIENIRCVYRKEKKRRHIEKYAYCICVECVIMNGLSEWNMYGYILYVCMRCVYVLQ